MGNSLSLITPATASIGIVVAMIASSHLSPPNMECGFVKSVTSFAHFASFSYIFGVQMWMIFVNGPTLSLLPRYTFSKVQRELTHRCFLTGFVMSGVMTSSYIARYPLSSWNGQSLLMGSSLLTSTLVSGLNILFIEQLVNNSMDEMFDVEKKKGLTNEKGGFKSTDYLKDSNYMVLYKRFYRNHGISHLVNAVGVAASMVQLLVICRNFAV